MEPFNHRVFNRRIRRRNKGYNCKDHKKMTEAKLHELICNYLHIRYPDVIFNTDLSGIKLTKGQAGKIKHLRSSRGFPDIVIYERRHGFSALFLELKKETPFRQDGKLKAGEHLSEQWNMLQNLNRRGYKALFVWSFEQAQEIIDKYLKIRVK